MSASAGRALDLLASVASSDRPMGLMELAEQSGLDKSTAGRLLGFLVQRELLRRHELTRRYEVGPALIALAAGALNRSELRGNASAHLRQLCEATGETTSLHLRIGYERVCIDGVESPHPVRRVLAIGERVPLHASPTGKVILAFLESGEAARALAAARNVGADMETLEETLELIRKERHMMAIGDRTPGVAAVSVPIFDRGSAPIASLTIAGPADRWTKKRMMEYVPELTAAAEQISAGIGVRVP